MKYSRSFVGMFILAFLLGCNTIENEWEKATELNTIEAYEQFVARYPESEFTAEAKKKIQMLKEKEDWDKAQRLNAIEIYEEFIANNPDSRHVAKAKENILALKEDKDWHDAQKVNSIKEYRNFLKKWPEGHKKEAAIKAIDQLLTTFEGTLYVSFVLGGSEETGLTLSYESTTFKSGGLEYSIRFMPDFEYIDHTHDHPRNGPMLAISIGGTYRLKGIVKTLQEIREESKTTNGTSDYNPYTDDSKKFLDVYFMELLDSKNSSGKSLIFTKVHNE